MVVLHAAAPANGQAPATRPAAAPASPLDGLPIRKLTITGLQQITESYVRNQVRSREDQPYSQDEVQRDVGRLLRTGRFTDVRAEPVLVENRVDLTLIISEKPSTKSVEFIGNKKYKAKDLLEVLTFAADDPLDLFAVRQGREAIERKYKEKGYSYVEVTFDEELLTSEQRVVYTIVENQRVRVRKIAFEGNTAFSDNELKRAIETKTYIWIFRTGDFDPDRAERDVATLQKYYRERGFLDAEAGYVPEFTDVARESLKLIFRINEGTRYRIKQMKMEGNTVFSGDELLAEMTSIKEGDWLIDAALQTGIKKVRTKYGANGYIYADVVPNWVFAEEPGQVVVTITVREGEQFEIGWIEVNGNFRTQEKCVRRELDFYPEEIFDTTRLDQAEKDLKDTGLFSEARIEPVGEGKRIRDVLVSVVENPNTNQFIAGVGASSDSGIVGNIMLENTNFDLFDRPRNWTEFFKGRAFRGAGQTMRIQFEPGTEFNRFRIDFREPYLLNKRIGFGTSLYLFERGRDGYDEQRVGTNVSFDHTFRHGLLKGWSGEIALRMEYVSVENVEAFAARDIQKVEGGNFLSSVKLTLLHDTTDSRMNPTSGHRFSASWEQAGALGGDFMFAKLSSGYSRHYTVYTDSQDRKSVVSLRGNIGQILGDAPVFERFYAGGIGSFRGFNFRGISPRDGLKKNRVGGDFSLIGGAEYSFPIFAKSVRGVFFSDMGTVEKDFGIRDWRMSVGGGIRLTLDVLGTIPMEFDLAFPISSNDEDDTRYFSFFIGLPFF